jgi:glycosyltransferase involved in cell wall biosynthesis
VKLLYFYQYFSTPEGGWGTRVYDFASEWVKKGHDVTVVSSIYCKSDLKAKKFIENQFYNGIKVKVINTVVDNKQSKLKRIWTFIVYAVTSSYYAIVLPADIVIASSGPITVGLPGLIAHYIRRHKLVFEARDLWPAGAIELGIIKNSFIKILAYWFEKRCYKAALLVVCLSPGMKDYITAKHHHPNVISITNAANIELFATPRNSRVIPELRNRKYAIYTGNIGLVNNSHWLLQAALELKLLLRQDIVILLVGDGQMREELINEALVLGLDNFIIHGLIPKVDLVGLIQNSIASLVPLLNSPVLQTSSPNKFFESLAAGVPVIQNTNGWMKEFLEKHKVGYTIGPNNPRTLAELLITLADNPDVTKTIKDRAIKVAKENFDKNKLAQQMLAAISDL